MLGVFYFPEYFIFVDFLPNLFNESGKKPNGEYNAKRWLRGKRIE
jgi:hypothetical protein